MHKSSKLGKSDEKKPTLEAGALSKKTVARIGDGICR